MRCRAGRARRRRRWRARSRRCCSSPPTRSRRPSWPTRRAPIRPRSHGALAELGEQYAPGLRGLRLRELGGGWTLASDPDTEEAATAPVQPPAGRDAQPRPGRDARDRRLHAARLAPGDRPHPRCQRRLGHGLAARPRPDRGGRKLAVRRRPVPHHGPVPEAVRPAQPEELPDIARWDPTPEEQAELRERLLRAGEARAGGERRAEPAGRPPLRGLACGVGGGAPRCRPGARRRAARRRPRSRARG